MRKNHYLWFNRETGRWCLADRELHCGDCFQILIGSAVYDVRIEHSNGPAGGWYLVGLPRDCSTMLDAYEARFYEEKRYATAGN